MVRLKDSLHNLVYSKDDLPFNPLVHVFFYITFVFGLSFTFFADPSGASASILYTLTQVYFTNAATSVWGLAALVITILNTLVIGTRHRIFKRWGSVPAWGGIMLWFYAIFIYFSGGFWFQALVGGIPNFIFWVWFRYRVKEFIADVDKAPARPVE